MSYRILVVDGESVSRCFFTSFFKREGHGSEFAASAGEAVDRLAGGRFDLVLIEVGGRGADGFETVAAIRESRAGRTVPVIFVNGGGLLANRERLDRAGVAGMITAPLDLGELRELMARAIAAEPPSEAPQLEDREALARCGGDRDFLAQLRAFFADSQAIDHGERLLRLVSEGDLDGLSRQAHTAKGSLFLIGANRAGELAKRIERWPGDNGREELRSLVLEFNDEMRALVAHIRRSDA